MKKRTKLTILIVAACLVLALTGIQALRMYNSARGLHWPGPGNRQMADLKIHRWMTVDEVADRYGVSTSEVFSALGITPAPGDEKLALKDLREKYNKTPEEMQTGLQMLIDSRGKGDSSPSNNPGRDPSSPSAPSDSSGSDQNPGSENKP